MRKQRQQQGHGVDNNAQHQFSQSRQLKQFLNNLRELVKKEYMQDATTYSRKNYREILQALGYEVKSFDNKAEKDRRDRMNGQIALKKFNKHYAAQANRHLRLFNEDPMQDPNYDPFQMIA